MSKNAHSLFEKYLLDNDSRYTSQKKAIATEIFKSNDHFEVEDFIDNIRAKDKKFSRATVYRTIKQLLEARLLQKISSIDGKILYEHSTPQNHHAHVICNICGNISEIEESSVKSIIDSECEKLGVIPQYLSLHVYGQCKDPETCKKKK
jgi:Fur family transcriptional regulator, ferric uptake regulator